MSEEKSPKAKSASAIATVEGVCVGQSFSAADGLSQAMRASELITKLASQLPKITSPDFTRVNPLWTQKSVGSILTEHIKAMSPLVEHFEKIQKLHSSIDSVNFVKINPLAIQAMNTIAPALASIQKLSLDECIKPTPAAVTAYRKSAAPTVTINNRIIIHHSSDAEDCEECKAMRENGELQ
jgi:hypothetical protein